MRIQQIQIFWLTLLALPILKDSIMGCAQDGLNMTEVVMNECNPTDISRLSVGGTVYRAIGVTAGLEFFEGVASSHIGGPADDLNVA